MKRSTPYTWSEVLKNLADRLPGLTETDFQFVQNCAADLINHLCRSSGKSHDEVLEAMHAAGLQIPDPMAKAETDEAGDQSTFAGEGSAVQEFR